MRYYAVKMTDPFFGTVVTFNQTLKVFAPDLLALYTWGSHTIDGILDPGALNIELDVPALPFGAFQGNIHARIWGVGLPELAQANNLSGYGIEILAGMKAPYNLNSAALSGQIVNGQIFQSYGNWEGVNQYLDFIIINGTADPDAEVDISFSWPAGTPIGTAITAALSVAYPTYEVLGAGLIKQTILAHDEGAHYSSIQSFAQAIQDMTASGSYSGVQIYPSGNEIYLYDNLLPQAAIPISFNDIIGQPTWISPTNISFSCVLRGDISIGDLVQLPTGIYPPYALTTAEAALPNAPSSNRLAFQGTFYVIEVHHYGNFRQGDADSWRTTYVATGSGL